MQESFMNNFDQLLFETQAFDRIRWNY